MRCTHAHRGKEWFLVRCIRISLLPRLFSRNSPTALVAFIVMQGLLKATLAIGLYLRRSCSLLLLSILTHTISISSALDMEWAREKKIPVLFLFFMYALFLVYTHTFTRGISASEPASVWERGFFSFFFSAFLRPRKTTALGAFMFYLGLWDWYIFYAQPVLARTYINSLFAKWL